MGVSPEVAKLVKENEELSARVVAGEQLAKNADTNIANLEAQIATLKTQNADLDTASKAFETRVTELDIELVAANEKITGLQEVTATFTAEAIVSTEKLAVATTTIADLTKIVDEAKTNADALEAAVTDVTETKEAAIDQLANLAANLGPKGLIPDLQENVPDNVSSAIHDTWVKLSKGSPSDKIAARKLYAANEAEINAVVAKLSNPEVATPAAIAVDIADKALFDAWTETRLRAKKALEVFGGVSAADRPKVHTQLTVEARKFYNSNKAAIDRVIASGDTSALAKTA